MSRYHSCWAREGLFFSPNPPNNHFQKPSRKPKKQKKKKKKKKKGKEKVKEPLV